MTTIYIYAEHVQGTAGRICRDAEDRGDDVVAYEGDEATLRETVADLRRRAKSAGAGSDLYLLRTARSIEEAIS